jgi:hypothetical protein
MHVIAHGPGDADATRRTLGLEPCHDIHCIPVQIGPIWNGVANVEAHTEADSSILWVITIMGQNLLLNLHRAAHGSVNAVEHDEQGVAPGLDDSATVLLYRRID